MLGSINDLLKFTLHAAGGGIGTIVNAYFDDAHWTVRYLVVSTGTWLSGRRVLVSPASVNHLDWFGHIISVGLTREQVRCSPDVTTDKPVSRQHKTDLGTYYGWPQYWNIDAFGFEPNLTPRSLTPSIEEPPGDPHLRSAREVKGYRIDARDGDIGHLSDCVFDEKTWAIRFFVLDSGTWLHHRLVLLRPQWIGCISWEGQRVMVPLTREEITTGPEFLADFPLSSEPEEFLPQFGLHEHFGGRPTPRQ